MPIKNGLEVVAELQEFFDKLISQNDRSLTAELFITKPKYIFLSGHYYNNSFV